MAAKKKYTPHEKSLDVSPIRNPFAHQVNFTFADKVQIVFMSIFVVPFRLLFAALCLIFAWVLASISLMGRTDEDAKEPLTGWRKLLRLCNGYLGRGFFVALGFFWIDLKGRPSRPEKAAIVVVGPHSGYMDCISFFTTTILPSPVSRLENASIPIFGTLTKFAQPVFVSREDPDSRQNTIKEIQRRAATNGKWPQIIIFPEGTCTNRTSLISYKLGAFIPGVPVQPVCLKYKSKLDTYTWTWEGPGALAVLWLTMCQFHNPVEIEYLPVYVPSEAEKKDPRLFANNVRALMAERLGIPVTDHTFEDVRMMNYALKLHLPAAEILVEFQKLHRKLGINLDQIGKVLQDLCSSAQTRKVHVTVEEFGKYLELPQGELLDKLFDLLNMGNSDTIDFRDYVMALHLVSQPAEMQETLNLAFKVYDKSSKGSLTNGELKSVIYDVFGLDDVDVSELFKKIEKQNEATVTLNEFKTHTCGDEMYAMLYSSIDKFVDQVVDPALSCPAELVQGPLEDGSLPSKKTL